MSPIRTKHVSVDNSVAMIGSRVIFFPFSHSNKGNYKSNCQQIMKFVVQYFILKYLRMLI